MFEGEWDYDRDSRFVHIEEVVATSGCDNEQYEHNDQMWRLLTSDLIDHCSEHDIDSD